MSANNDVPEFRDVARGRQLPSPEQIVFRLRAGAWDLRSVDGEAEGRVGNVLAAIDAVADTIDSQGPLAPDWLNRLSLNDIGGVFARLVNDRQLAFAHRPGEDGLCTIDGEADPCNVHRALVLTYLTRDDE